MRTVAFRGRPGTLLRRPQRKAGLRQADLAEPLPWVSKVLGGERRFDVLERRRVWRAIGLALSAFVERPG